MLLLILLFKFVNSQPDFVILGIDSNFSLVPGLSFECNETVSCHNYICKTLQQSSFAAMVPISDNITLRKIYIPVNMIVFGIDTKRIVQHSAFVCYTFMDCFDYGINIKNAMWFIFAGQCYYK